MNPFNNSPERTTTMYSNEMKERTSNMSFLLSEVKVNLPALSQETPGELGENDKIIFDELKELIFQGDAEKLLAKLVEFTDFPIDAQNNADDNYTLLHHAAEKKSVDCLRILVVDFLANTNIKANNGWTAMHVTVLSDCRCEHCTQKTLSALQILMEGGADVDLGDVVGETCLYYAARNRLSKAAQFLLNNGADINHWVNGTSVATLLAQFVPDVLKAEFDKCITIHEKERMNRGLRLDFRLLLQDVAIHEGFTVRNSSLYTPPPSSTPGKGIFPPGWSQRQLRHGSHGKMVKAGEKGDLRSRNRSHDDRMIHPSSVSSLSSLPASVLSTSLSSSIQSSPMSAVPPRETELLNYLLRADLAAIEAVVNHPFVEAFVHLKWLSVRNVFFFFRSLYLFLILLYTFYVFDTFVNVTCFYNVTPAPGTNTTTANTTSFSPLEKVTITGRDNNGTLEKAAFGQFSPSAPSVEPTISNSTRKPVDSKEWTSFSQYFKAHEMSCEPTLRITVMAYLFAIYAICTILYETYKILFEGWYDYFRVPLNFVWWILAINIGISLTPGLGLYAHTWHYPHATFTLVYGWILVLATFARIPYFGVFIGIFVKVVKDFCLLLLTFFPVLMAFALGFSVMLPQNEFFRFIPLGVFKVFLMMTGDVDFWGVFSGTWTSSSKLKGHIHLPLFVIYSVYILMVTMVLMSLLLGLAVENIQEVRREAALNRTVDLIREIGILESILHKPTLYYCGCLRYFRRIFSITSLDLMNGPELITFPEDPNDTTLPSDIKQKLVPYLLSSCCCSDQVTTHKKREPKKEKNQNKTENHVVGNNGITGEKSAYSNSPRKRLSTGRTTANEITRRQFFEENKVVTHAETSPNRDHDLPESSNKERAHRDLMIYKEVKLLLDDNEKLRARLETLQRKLLTRKM